MCGIIGYTGHRPALPVVLEGLRHLEYRGYDSAGVGYVLQKKLHRVRAKGKLHNLEDALTNLGAAITVSCAIGHTRWATHGIPEERNAHPHFSNDGTLALVHNGIIENYQELKAELVQKGYGFESDTDTEVLINLISFCRQSEPSLLAAFAKALSLAHGAYAVCMLDCEAPQTLYAARMQAPLLVGKGVGEYFIASDIPAFLASTRDVLFLEDGEIVVASPNTCSLYTLTDIVHPLKREVQTIQWGIQAAQKGGYRHFMLKEIFEQPTVIQDCLSGRIKADNHIDLPELASMPLPKQIHIVACGTSYHAGLWGQHILENLAHIPVTTEIASEFRYKERFLIPQDDLVLVISQSGETADTLAALRTAKEHSIPTLALCNVLGSSLAREADRVCYTQAGPEISVASTKAMTSQMLLLTCLALFFGEKKGVLDPLQQKHLLATLKTLPITLANELPTMHEKAKFLARKYAQAKSFFFLGRGHCFSLALEGALKLKELSYIHAEGYACGEMKHGPIALIDPHFPSLVLALDDAFYPKITSNVVEIQSRQGRVIAITNPGTDIAVDDRWEIPKVLDPLSAFCVLPCLQLFSYEMADYLGKDVDQPRNLAKSVTVE
ncbi:MAG: glutamine--fructose-6-phosphate transaminase (isomerizing) [Desulfovibrio sp.]|nr:glutamine--fructose-6-phosphate transaminase (isomerizing) [Desulfovibrio sp.]